MDSLDSVDFSNSSLPPGTGNPQEVFSPREHFSLENHLWIYSAPFILVFSVAGNIMTMLIMTQRCMRESSTCVYLTMMAITDMSVVVIGIIPEWLHQIHITTIWELHPYVCKVENWLYYTMLDTAIWSLVAFTCDRVIAVCFPFHKKQFCTKRRAIVACTVVFLLANLNLHVFWTRGRTYHMDGTIKRNCGDIAKYAYFERVVRPWIVLAAASIGPFIVIMCSNIAIVCELLRSRTLQERKSLKSATVMCMSISFAFLILVTPNIVLLIGKPYWNPNKDNVMYSCSRAIASQFVYINHSVNFLLYALTGSKFREELVVRWRASFRRSAPREHYALNLSSSSKPAYYKTSTSVPPSPASAMIGRGRFVWQKSVESSNGNLRVNYFQDKDCVRL